MKKRCLSLLLALLMLLTLFPGAAYAAETANETDAELPAETVSTEEEAAPTEEEAAPTEEEAAPTEEEAAPTEEEAAPTEEEAAPTEEEAALAEEEATPDVEEAAPAEEETTPDVEEAAPAEEEATPDVDEATPDVEEAAPAEEEAAPAEEEAAPAEEEAVPAEEEAAPAEEEAALAEEEPVLAEEASEEAASEDLSEELVLVEGGILREGDAEIMGVTVGSGSCGDKATYKITAEGSNGFVLTISGSGAVTSHPWNAEALASATVSEGITSLCAEAFSGGTRLTSVSLPESLTSIGQKAFYGCTKLTRIDIPYNTTSLGKSLLEGCTSLSSISMSINVKTIPDRCFYGCSSLVGSALIPDNATAIGSYAFYGTGTTSVYVPSKVTSIGAHAFEGLAITSLTLPSGLTSIGYSAFGSCTKLTTVTLPASLSSMGGYAFQACTNLATLTISDGVKTIGESAFSGCSKLQTVTIPSSVTSLGGSAFYGCTGLKSVSILAALTEIPYACFENCANMTSISLPSSLSRIESCAFINTTLLGSITIPSNVSFIGLKAFSDEGHSGSNSARSITITFTGNAPTFDSTFGDNNAFLDRNVTAEYPDSNSTWTASVRQSYGARSITWKGVGTPPSVSGVTAPTGTRTQGQSMTLKGTISAGSGTLSKVGARVYAATDTNLSTPKTGTEVSASGKTYTIKGSTLDSSCKIGSLTPGSYIYVITATVGGTKYELYRSSFTIKAATYTITYDANGGTGAPASQTKTHGKALTLSSVVPTREGCTFKGWSIYERSSLADYQPGDSYTDDSSVTLYAVWWTAEYEVRLHFQYQQTELYVGKKLHGETYQINVEDRRYGYEFLGWDPDPQAATAQYPKGSYYSEDADIDLYPIFSPTEKTVTFDPNGGEGGPGTLTKYYDIDVIIPDETPTRDGYTFVAWGYSANAKTGLVPGDIFTSDSTSRLYAIWRQNGTAIVNAHVLYGTVKEYDENGEPLYSTQCYGFYSDDTEVIDLLYSYSEWIPLHWNNRQLRTIELPSVGLSFDEWGIELYAASLGNNINGNPVKIVGWTTEEHGRGTVVTERTVIDGDMDIYPVYASEETVRVLFDANGGINTPSTQVAARGQSFVLTSETPTLEGIDFLGWSENSKATVPDYLPGDSFTADADLTLYAVWDAYSVVYVTEKGTNGSADKTTRVFIQDDEFRVTDYIPAKTFSCSNNYTQEAQYTFLYWTDGVSDTQYLPGERYPLSANLALEPVWKESDDDFHYAIKLRGMSDSENLGVYYPTLSKWIMGSSGRVINSRFAVKEFGKTVEEYGIIIPDQENGKVATVDPNQVIDRESRFVGWFTEDDLQLTKYTVVDESLADLLFMPRFATDTSTRVSYDPNGGTLEPMPQFAEAGEILTLSDTEPVRLGAQFLGWATDAEAAEAAYFPGETYSFTVDTTLYAVWKIETYFVRYDANGGEGAPADQSSPVGETLTLSTAVPTREGYDFLGWAESEEADSPDYQPGAVYSANRSVLLRAVWQLKSYPVTYDANGGAGEPEPQTKLWGKDLYLSTAEPDREAYDFLGWSVRSDAEEPEFRPGDVYCENAALTLYAVWERALAAPTITTQPKDTTTAAGKTVTFTVEAEGEDLSYQWQVRKDSSANWVNSGISSAKTATLSFAPSATLNGYQYRCVVTNAAGSVESSAVTLTIVPAPTITTQPESVSAAAGKTISFKVVASGDGLSYQWQVRKNSSANWANSGISSAKTSILSFAPSASLNGYQYRCVVTGAGGTATSNAATLTIIPAPTITTQPTSVSTGAGKTISFKVVATGDGLSYQWQVRKDSSSNWVNSGISSAKTATLSFAPSASLSGYQYRCVVTGTGGSVNSAVATLTIIPAPTITTPPVSVTTAAGKTISFKVVATGESLSYQWQVRKNSTANWANSGISSAKTATLTFAPSASLNGYQYRCVVTGSGGTAISNAATLTISSTAGAPAITVQPSSVSTAAGKTISFKVTATGTGLSYQWQVRKDASSSWVNSGISSAKTATLTFAPSASLNGYQYRCVVTNTAGTATSNAATLYVN